MPHEPEFSITDEMIDFNERAQGATAALLKNLHSAGTGARLSATVAKVSAIIASEYGVEITPDQALTLPGVKSAVLGSSSIDRDTVIFAAKNKIPAVAYAAGEWGQADSGSQQPANWDDLRASEKINWARRHGLA